MTSAGFSRGYISVRKALRFKKLRKKMRFRVLSLLGRGPSFSGAGSPPMEWMEQGTIFVAIRVTGGLGDFIVVARLIRDICAQVENLKIHLFCPSEGVAAWVFKSLPGVAAIYSETFYHHVHSRYDCAMAFNQMAYYFEENTRYEKIRVVAPSFLKILGNLGKSRPLWDVYIQHHPFLDGAMAHTAVALGETRNTLLHSMCGLTSSGYKLDFALDDTVSKKVRGDHRKWITVNNGFDANFAIGSMTATKCYPLEHWNKVISIIKEKRPDIAVVQIGSKTSKRITGVDVDLIGATSLPQAASLIKGSLLHLDNEGGLVHVAASMNKKSAVMFGPTSIKYFAYPENINLDSKFCGNCWWSRKTWMEACPRGFDSPLCMDYLQPELVAVEILRDLNQVDQSRSTADSTAVVASE